MHTGHHELIFWRDSLLDTLLLLGVYDLVADFAEVNLHWRLPVSHASVRSLDRLVHKPVAVSVTMATSVDGQALFNEEANSVSIKLAVLVVDFDMAIGDLVGQEDVLFENRAHSAGALINATPSLNSASLRLGFTDNKVDRLLANDHDLLVLHRIMLVMSVQGCLHVVLDLGLGLFARVLVLEMEGRGNVMRQLSLELNLVDTWVENSTLDVKHAVLVLKEFLAVLKLVSVMDRLVTILSCVMADERALLATLDLELDVGGFNGFHNFEVNNTANGITWLVEGILRLELNFTLGELAPFV